MIRFNNDYNRTAHPRVWEVLQQAAQESHPGYGTDDWCARAEGIIRELTGQPDAAVWFFPGATQANFIVISAPRPASDFAAQTSSVHSCSH